ncbi:hypothetical protein OAP58_02685 [Candidatus Pelagibacter sp.]|nr:hypothetical protein [Candidatus Pelagibacter sp.]
MFIKKSLIIILLIFLSHCGFSPMFKNINNSQYNIILESVDGDREINNLIKSNLNRYGYEENRAELKINIKTKYVKDIIAKDSTGKTTDYQIKILTIFELQHNKGLKTITIEEAFDYKSIDDKLAELDYERSIKINLTNIIISKLITQISRLK